MFIDALVAKITYQTTPSIQQAVQSARNLPVSKTLCERIYDLLCRCFGYYNDRANALTPPQTELSIERFQPKQTPSLALIIEELSPEEEQRILATSSPCISTPNSAASSPQGKIYPSKGE
jgi:hypothetical protein